MLMGAEWHPLQLIFRYSGSKQVTVAEWTFKEIYKHPWNKRSGDGSLDICLCQDLNPKGEREIFSSWEMLSVPRPLSLDIMRIKLSLSHHLHFFFLSVCFLYGLCDMCSFCLILYWIKFMLLLRWCAYNILNEMTDNYVIMQ